MDATTEKWKFFHNGYAWWLRIDTLEQLIHYFELTDENRFGGSMMNVAYNRMGDIDGYDGNRIAECIDILSQVREEDLLTATGRFRLEAHQTYLKNFQRAGFVNINRVGGCNSSDWNACAVTERKELIFPSYTKKDVKIKTWEMGEKQVGVYRNNYKYHWYAYIGDVRITDGDKEKWDSEEEARAFVDKMFYE